MAMALLLDRMRVGAGRFAQRTQTRTQPARAGGANSRVFLRRAGGAGRLGVAVAEWESELGDVWPQDVRDATRCCGS